MARRILIKNDGLDSTDNAPSGYKYLGDDNNSISEKNGATVSRISLLKTTVSISSAQIKLLGTTPVTLLPPPGANKYYDVEKITLEYTYGGAAYTLNTNLAIKFGGVFSYYSATLPSLVTLTDNAVCDSNSFYTYDLLYDGQGYNGTTSSVPVITPINKEVLLTTLNGSDPGGKSSTGTMRALIDYSIRTFGS